MTDPAEFEEREDLSASERRLMAQSIRLKAALVHEIIREEGEEELTRDTHALAWSGLAAGLSMGFSLVVEGLLHHHLPDAPPWRPLIASFGYTTGFVIVVLGRQQLFTENTLTGVIPALTRRDRASLLALLRLWVVVLIANLIGAGLFAALAAAVPAFEPNLHQDFLTLGQQAAAGGFAALFVKAVLAGWLIALMVWLLPGAGSARLIVILLITYIVALGGFAHIIAGSVDVLYRVLSGEKSLPSYLLDFLLPVLAGNVIGGSALVAMLNHAQVRSEVPAVAEAEALADD
jgi:formate/nitrite transporter FocA (FNT family)